MGVTAGSFVAPWAGVRGLPRQLLFRRNVSRAVRRRSRPAAGSMLGIQGKVGMIRLGFYQGYVSANSEFGVLHLPDFNSARADSRGDLPSTSSTMPTSPVKASSLAETTLARMKPSAPRTTTASTQLALRKPFIRPSHPDRGARLCRQRGHDPASLRSVLDRGIPELVGIQVQSARRPGIFLRRDRLHVPVRQPPLASGKRALPGRISSKPARSTTCSTRKPPAGGSSQAASSSLPIRSSAPFMRAFGYAGDG